MKQFIVALAVVFTMGMTVRAQAPAPAAGAAAPAVAAPAAAAPAAAAPAAAAPAAAVTPPAAGAANNAPTMEAPNEGAAPAKHGGFWEVISRAGWFGELIWAMLFGCLGWAVYLVVDAFITVNDKAVAPTDLSQKVRQAMEEGDVFKAMQHCDSQPTPMGRILKAGFVNVQEGYEVVQDAVSVAADIESEKLMQRVSHLSVISNTTPMLGLIGTVQGMIFAFGTLGTTTAGAAQQALLALNISHGLWATAVGLGTSVPATMFYYFFKNKATRLILGMEAMTLDQIKSLRNVEVVE